MSRFRVAVAQMRSTPVVADNLSTAIDLIRSAKLNQCAAIFLPEATDYIAQDKQQAFQLAQPLSGSFVSALCDAAASYGIHVSVGVHEAPEPKSTQDQPARDARPASDNRFFNTHLLIDDKGDVAGIYRKIHLFDVNIENGPVLMESSTTIPGSRFPKPIKTPFGSVGLATCYDMRFAEHALLLRRFGSDMITFPSAFTVKTGVAHWETLLRCRAIETQCFVIASAQIGKHTQTRESYGHAMIIDPWGDIIANCGTQENVIQVADLDMARLESVRQDMPVESHRRHDLYQLDLVRHVM